jgi:anti-anti-sigma factor
MWEIKKERISKLPLLRLKGGLVSGAAAESLVTAVSGLVAHRRVRIMCHAAGVDRIDSSGLAALAAARETTVQAGGRFVLIAPSPRVRVALDATRLMPRFDVAADEAEAVRLLRDPPKREFPTGFERDPGV